MDGPPGGFSPRDAKRIADAVKWHERRPRNQAFARGRYPVGGGVGLIPVQAPAGGVAAGSLTAPTSATVTYLQPTGTGAALQAATGPGSTTTAYNIYRNAVPSDATGKACWAAWSNGLLYLVDWEC